MKGKRRERLRKRETKESIEEQVEGVKEENFQEPENKIRRRMKIEKDTKKEKEEKKEKVTEKKKEKKKKRKTKKKLEREWIKTTEKEEDIKIFTSNRPYILLSLMKMSTPEMTRLWKKKMNLTRLGNRRTMITHQKRSRMRSNC